jgi:5-methylcytosine-specific restriction endonuclease McrA
MNRYVATTSGERLFQFIYGQLENEQVWRYLEDLIRPVGNADRYAGYFRQHAALSLCCKLISAGKARISPDSSENLTLLLPVVEGYPWNRLNSGNRLLRFLSTAVLNSDRPISNGVASRIRVFSQAKHPFCYICGTRLVYHDSANHSYYTVDHVWPASYGGESIEENLLPACQDCNTKKGNLPTWVATDVHSLFLGFEPTPRSLSQVKFAHRYALYNRTAFAVAINMQLTLRQALLKLGHWADLRLHDSNEICDMFNLKTHQETDRLQEYEIV